MRTDLSKESRVWVYQADKLMSTEEREHILSQLKQFCLSWTAHNMALKADCDILYNKFIVLTVDETQAGASGCSIDKSVKALKELSDNTGINFFDRMQVYYLNGEELKGVHVSEVDKLKQDGLINKETKFFNPLVKTLGELEDAFLVPFQNHWLNK